MKHRLLFFALLLSLICTPVAAGEGGFAAAFGKGWAGAESYLMEMTEAMPADAYGFKPTPEIWTFGKQAAHIADVIYTIAAKIAGEENPGKGFEAAGKNKAEIIAYLTRAFAYSKKVLAGLDDEKAHEKVKIWGFDASAASWFHMMRDHTTHHRGQMVIYLRLKGVKPPEYR